VNCKKVTYYIDKAFLTELTGSEKLQVKLHAFICKHCKHYLNDSECIDRMLKSLKDDTRKSELLPLEKEVLKAALKKVNNHSS
jgi:hypothetical protein